MDKSQMMSAREALERLKKGNKEFVASLQGNGGIASGARRGELPQVQDPFAVVLGCSDARVPSEIIFNQGPGDLFVIRVVGNIVSPSQLGSIEYAVAHLNAPLVVVVGHTQCGAIRATLEELQQPTGGLSSNLRYIVDQVKPSIEALLKTDLRNDMPALKAQAVRANVSASVDKLRHGSELMEQGIQKNGLAVVGAEYSLETGVVEFFDTAGAE